MACEGRGVERRIRSSVVRNREDREGTREKRCGRCDVVDIVENESRRAGRVNGAAKGLVMRSKRAARARQILKAFSC